MELTGDITLKHKNRLIEAVGFVTGQAVTCSQREDMNRMKDLFLWGVYVLLWRAQVQQKYHVLCLSEFLL